MEWLGILLLYLISGFMKKRQQDAKRRNIESDPTWDTNDEFEAPPQQKKSKPSLDQLIENFLEGIDKFDPENEFGLKSKKTEPVIVEEPVFMEEEEYIEPQIVYPDDDLTTIDEQSEAFEEKIYHSNLADRDEQHFGKKWRKKGKLRSELIQSKNSLKKAIILKEILDKPIALRKN